MRAPIAAIAALCCACSALVGIEDVEEPELGLDVSAPQLELTAGKEARLGLQTSVREGGPQDLTLTISGLPPGVVATVNPATMKSGDRAMVTLRAARDTAEATQAVTITAATATVTKEVSVSLQIIAVSEFALRLPEPRAQVAAGASVSYELVTSVTSGRPEEMTLFASRLPDGVTAAFAPPTIRAGERATLTLTAGKTMAQIEGAEFVVEGHADSAVHAASGWITVTNDFALEVGPPAGPLPAGGTLSLAVKAKATSGPPQAVTLDVAGLPAGVTASFDPPVLTGDGSGTLTLVATPGAAQTTATLTVGAQGASGHKSMPVPITVGPPFLVNGGFETGKPDGWLYDPALVGTTAKGAHGGKYAAWIGLDYGVSVLGQKLRVPATGQTKVSAWVFQICNGSYPSDAQQLLVLHGDASLARTVYSQCITSTAWTEVVVDLTPFAGQEIYLLFGVVDAADGLATMSFVDDVTVINR